MKSVNRDNAFAEEIEVLNSSLELVLQKLVSLTSHVLAFRKFVSLTRHDFASHNNTSNFKEQTMQNSSFGRRGRWSSSSQPSQGPIKTPPAPPLGSLLQQLTPEQLKGDDQDTPKRVEINDVKFLASYNWIESNVPTIIFPGKPEGRAECKHQALTYPSGMPAVWDPPLGTRKLPKDSGRYFRDPNAARHPSHPMEPAVKTVLAQVPDLKTDQFDIFGCTSTLGSLMRFLKNHDKPFRFTVEAVGRTVFFVRRENAPDELIPGPKGFGPTGHGTLQALRSCRRVPKLTDRQATPSPSVTPDGRKESRTRHRISVSSRTISPG